jgi:hypothetical protein
MAYRVPQAQETICGCGKGTYVQLWKDQQIPPPSINRCIAWARLTVHRLVHAGAVGTWALGQTSAPARLCSKMFSRILVPGGSDGRVSPCRRNAIRGPTGSGRRPRTWHLRGHRSSLCAVFRMRTRPIGKLATPKGASDARGSLPRAGSVCASASRPPPRRFLGAGGSTPTDPP